MKNHFRTGAILALISGVLGLVWSAVVFANLHYAYWWQIVLAVAVFELIAGLFSAITGAFAWKFKIWSLCLASAIAGIFTFFPTGIAAIVYLGLDRKNHKASAQPA